MNNEQLGNIPEEYKPISMWGYFGYQILFSLPLIGIISVIYLAICAKNWNVKNFAKSYFCVAIIFMILTAIIVAIAGFIY